MSYKYTTEGCFKGELLKQPPLPADDPDVAKRILSLKSIKRRWFHTGCAMEELGRFGAANPSRGDVEESALVWHLHDILTNPQPIENNDGYGPARIEKGVPLFAPRMVIATLVDHQLKCGIGDVLTDYFGFQMIGDKYFGNTEKTYGMHSRIAAFYLCTTRYVVDGEEDNKENDVHASTSKRKGPRA